VDLQLLQPNAPEVKVLEQSQTAAENDRHDVETQLVDQAGAEQLLDDARAAWHLYHLVTGRGLRLLDRSLHALGDERERQVLVLLRSVRRRMVRDDEDRHLELVVADE
jgi:hypothetical protein